MENAILPDSLFIDVEGFEGHTLARAKALIMSQGATLGIFVEIHTDLWSVSETNREGIASLITALGRCPIPLSGKVDPLGEYGHVLLELR